MIGLIGAHRVGKTTLAKSVAEQLNLPLITTRSSAVFQRLGLDPAKPMTFLQRMEVQFEVLADATQLWSEEQYGFVTDRTPIDMLAYTMADVNGATLDEACEGLLRQYTEACIRVNNRLFKMLVLIQPGIEVVPEPGKASLSEGYREHLNALMFGLMMDTRFQGYKTYLRRENTDFDTRQAAVVSSFFKFAKTGSRPEGCALH